jgi:hypothetical protein
MLHVNFVRYELCYIKTILCINFVTYILCNYKLGYFYILSRINFEIINFVTEPSLLPLVESWLHPC